jgi:subtilisin-like proprotein convertase family protein
MKNYVRGWQTAFAVFLALLVVTASAVVAFQVRPKTSRFDALVVEDPTDSLDVAATPVASLPSTDKVRGAWEAFRATHGPSFAVYLDRRSGAPLLVEGKGIPWLIAKDATVETIAASLRTFMTESKTLLLADNAELVLDREASGKLTPDVWQIAFRRAIADVPVVGERYVFTIGHGNLISFGAPRWSRIDASPFADIDPSEALVRLTAYMGLNAADGVNAVDKGTLQLIPLRAAGTQAGAQAGPYTGAIGSGYDSALVWRLALRVDGEPGTWEALVDAHTGAIRSFRDINDYAQAKGGVFPVSDDGLCPDGCEQANYPMPYTNITIGATNQTASALGLFNCTPAGSTATTTLAGQYVRVVDTCGGILQSVSCDNDLDLSASAGTDCAVPPGSSLGNTHASRTGFYHLNRIAEHARVWLPTRPWLSAQLTDNVNLNQTCNAYWNGSSVNFFKSGGGCRNTGEIAGVFLHEWGHGMDSNDGGGTDNPGEAYADITAFMSTHVSCVGRGFFMSSNCDGYGDACLNCTGIRDQDWNAHASHAPATPAGFLTTNCPSGSGPCGKEVHCESYVGAETLWDLAVRDLPASGLDLASAWQLADKLWYKSRLGSGGNAYNCALPNSDGCSAISWFQKLRTIDDDDGNLANGTPHAAAIFAAFNRHRIACGAVGDASNQNSTTCPSIGATVLTATAGSSSAQLNWTAVANATGYKILRNDASCAAGSTIIATVPGTTFTDTGLANGFPEYYAVQAVGANAACDGLLSNCQPVVPQPFAGLVKLDNGTYSCSGSLVVTAIDGNIGASTTTVQLTSATEPGGETITLTQVSPGSASYAGTVATTGSAPTADGMLSVANGDTITATYIDADDGQGGVDLPRQTTAGVDCLSPIITNVHLGPIGGNTATILWDTDEPANSAVTYGTTPPPGTTPGVMTALTTSHSVLLNDLATCTPYVFSVTSTDAWGNATSDDNGGVYYGFTTGANIVKNIAYAGPPVPIPDNNPTGGTATINVPDNKVISDVNVTIGSLTHTYDGDIVIHLIGPDNTDVILSDHRGGGGNNFIGTVFDDSAVTPISAGTAPFTGSFTPDAPLSAFNGKIAMGAWRLFVVDVAAIDSGSINSWTLNFTLAQTCAPHAVYVSHALVADSCATGGAGGNALWEPGEQVQFKVNVLSDGSVTLTGVSATVVPTTPGVTMVNDTATYPNLAGDTSADSIAPHFTAQLPTDLACGSSVSFQISVNANEGSWSNSFNQAIGQVFTGTGTAFGETFATGIPATWTVVDGGVGGNAPATTWTTANPGARTIAAPMAAPVAIVDSDIAGSAAGVTQDEQLITPAIDLQTVLTATLHFDQWFRWYSGGLSEIADVDVRSILTAGAWVNVLRQQNASSLDPDHKAIDITAQAAGAADVQVRFHYYNGHFEWWWQVDNVRVEYTAPGGCNQTVCSTAPGIAKPVADGTYGSAMTASRADVPGSTIDLTWDVSTCSSTDHHVLYGDLANVASSTVSGGLCDLGTSGSTAWTGVPDTDLWFVVVGNDNASTEGSWGLMTSGERGGASPSGQCGVSTRDNAATCP